MMKKSILAAVCLIAAGSSAQAMAAKGKASFYGGGGRTASGGKVGHLTAAHRTLPFGTKLRVVNLHNQRSVVVTVNDRGPFIRGRIVDVSMGAAKALGFHREGVASVRIETVQR